MKTLKNIKLLFCFVVMLTIFLTSACNHDNDKDKNKVPEQLGTMEITGLNVESENLNPATLVDGKKKITVNNAKPKLEVKFKKKYDELKGEVKIADKKTAIAFSSAEASYTFAALTKDTETPVEIVFTAKNMKPITLKFKLFYKELEALNITKITVAGTEYIPPFETTLTGQNIEVKKNDVTIVVETADGTEELTGNVNNSSFTRDPARQNIASVRLTNLAEGENDITLKASAKDKKEVTYTFKITWTRLPPIGIAKITIDDTEYAKGEALNGLNNSEVEITKKGAINIKVELEEDYEEKKVQLKSAGEGVSTKPANWTGKVATLSCKEEWKNVDIVVKAKDKEDSKYSVTIERVKGEIEVAQILLDDEKYGTFGKDLALLLSSATATEKVNVKKEKITVKVTLKGGEKIDKGEVTQQETPATTKQLSFSGNIAEVELTLKEGDNNCTLHLERTTKQGAKITADYKFNLHYTKQNIAFGYIRMKLNDDDKGKEDVDLPYIHSKFVKGSDEIYAYKKDYSLWNTEAKIICWKKTATDVSEYSISKTKATPTTWTAFTKEFKVTLDETPSYVYFKAKNVAGTEERIYLAELTPLLTEKGVVKHELEYLTEDDKKLYAESGLTKKVKIIIKPKDPRTQGIKAISHSNLTFTKVPAGAYPKDKFKGWYVLVMPFEKPLSTAVTCEVTESDGSTSNHEVQIKIVKAMQDIEIGYDANFNEKVTPVIADNKITFTLEKTKIVGKKIYVRMYLAEYHVIEATEGVVFEGESTQEINGNYYILKTVEIENFEDSKSFGITIKQDDGVGNLKSTIEIKTV